MATYSKEKLKATTKGTGNFVRCMDFDVDIGNVSAGGIVKLDGLKFEYDTTEYKHAEAKVMEVQPGHPKRVSVTFHREFAGHERTFRDHRQKVLNGEVLRTSITIHFKNHAGEPIGLINLHNAWPSAYHMPNPTSASSGHAVEKCTYVSEEYDIKFG